jgi:hypothetical protein
VKIKTMAPRDVRNLKQVCSLRTDNHDTKNGWMMLDSGKYIVLVNQVIGNRSTGEVKFTRGEFNRLIRWYTRPQRLINRAKP